MSTPTIDTLDGTQELDPTQVNVGTNNGPGIWIARAMTPVPEHTYDPFTADGGWSTLGYLSDDGPTVGTSTDSESLTPWQSASPIKTVITSRTVTLQAVMWQLNELTLSVYFDTDVPEVSSDGEIDMEVRTDQSGHEYAIAIDARDGNRVYRISFLRCSLSDAGDQQIQRGAIVPLDVTLSALETNGVLARVQLGKADVALPMSASVNGTGVTAAAADLSPGAAARRSTSRAETRDHHPAKVTTRVPGVPGGPANIVIEDETGTGGAKS